MAFLGAGQSHVEGRYQGTRRRGHEISALHAQTKRTAAEAGTKPSATPRTIRMAWPAWRCEAYGWPATTSPARSPKSPPVEMTEEERKAWKEKAKTAQAARNDCLARRTSSRRPVVAQLHHAKPASGRRLAIQHRPARRHVGRRLDADGPQERPHGAVESQPANRSRHKQVPRHGQA